VSGDATVQVVVDAPRHAGLAPLDYRCDGHLTPGTLVRVPLGRREVAGVVWRDGGTSQMPIDELRPIAQQFDAIGALSAPWMALVEFTAAYYQRSIGEVALAALPSELRRLSAAQLAARVRRSVRSAAAVPPGRPPPRAVALSAEQASALAAIDDAARRPRAEPLLLHGVTGSGKTEVYLRAIEETLRTGRQAIVLVPEIALTPPNSFASPATSSRLTGRADRAPPRASAPARGA